MCLDAGMNESLEQGAQDEGEGELLVKGVRRVLQAREIIAKFNAEEHTDEEKDYWDCVELLRSISLRLTAEKNQL